jgi:hypothetical protein
MHSSRLPRASRYRPIQHDVGLLHRKAHKTKKALLFVTAADMPCVALHEGWNQLGNKKRPKRTPPGVGICCRRLGLGGALVGCLTVGVRHFL